MSDGPKTALELALEKLDAQGVTARALTEDQKAEIAEIRSKFQSRIAQEEITADSHVKKCVDPSEAQAIRQRLANERERLNREMDRAVEDVRGSKG